MCLQILCDFKCASTHVSMCTMFIPVCQKGLHKWSFKNTFWNLKFNVNQNFFKTINLHEYHEKYEGGKC